VYKTQKAISKFCGWRGFSIKPNEPSFLLVDHWNDFNFS